MFEGERNLNGKKIAILATDGFEESELLETKHLLEENGVQCDIIAPKPGKIRAWNQDRWGVSVIVDDTAGMTTPDVYDALVLPGGVINSDKLRADRDAVDLVADFAVAGKPIAAICHAPWILIEAGVAKNRKLTSWPSLRTDLENAGNEWIDEEAVVDGHLVTSRKPDDIPAFVRKLTEIMMEGPHRFGTPDPNDLRPGLH